MLLIFAYSEEAGFDLLIETFTLWFQFNPRRSQRFDGMVGHQDTEIATQLWGADDFIDLLFESPLAGRVGFDKTENCGGKVQNE
jgi:hypothetical protein